MGRPPTYKQKTKVKPIKQLTTMTSHPVKHAASEVIAYIRDNGVGPNQFSNWVVYPGLIPKGRILMSAYPYRGNNRSRAGDSVTTMKDYENQVRAFPNGVTYICLQERSELDRLKLPMYYGHKTMKDLKKKTGVKTLDFENDLEIPDMFTAGDEKVATYVRQLAIRYLNGESFVIHCLGGHGRTGTIAGILLGYLLLNVGIDHRVEEIFAFTRKSHDMRKQRNGWVDCPQGEGQRGQIERLYRQKAQKMKIFIPQIQVIVPKSSAGPRGGWGRNQKGQWVKEPVVRSVSKNDPEWNSLPLLKEEPIKKVNQGCLSSLIGALRSCWGGSAQVTPVAQPPADEQGVDVGAWDFSETARVDVEDIDLTGFWDMDSTQLEQQNSNLVDDLINNADWYQAMPETPVIKKPIHQLAPLKLPVAHPVSYDARDYYGSRKKPSQIEFEMTDLY